PSYTEVWRQVMKWADESRLDSEKAALVRSFWPSVDLRDANGTVLLQRAAETFAAVDLRALKLVQACNTQYQRSAPPDGSWLGEDDVPELVRNNLSLYHARWLAQHGLYDEVLIALEGLTPEDVIDPAGLLFYRMVAHHQLVEPEESRTALVQLLEHEDALPRRYQQIAQLLQRDLKGLKDESLDHIARRMNDVRRRLDFGRAGKEVQMVEQGVLDSLDKLIEKLEQQAQQQASSGGSGSQQGAQPMQDSRLPSMRAPMQVEQRDVGSKSGWGDLPPKEREEALQQIGREFPAYYRELIEQYFRELAEETTSSPSK
ncbi:MAG: hypothetical protein ACR2NU_07620, partial [Aeoliella sp.]